VSSLFQNALCFERGLSKGAVCKIRSFASNSRFLRLTDLLPMPFRVCFFPEMQFTTIVLLLAKNEQIYETLARLRLGAFFAPQKTGLCGAPRFRAPAPPAAWLLRTPSIPCALRRTPSG
jgi:hypothetical protein